MYSLTKTELKEIYSREQLKGLLLRAVTGMTFRPESIKDKEQFLDDFDSKMNRLVDIRRNLQNSVQFKQQFFVPKNFSKLGNNC